MRCRFSARFGYEMFIVLPRQGGTDRVQSTHQAKKPTFRTNDAKKSCVLEDSMKKILLGILGGVFAPVLVSSVLWAQATAQISGTVKDQTGAVLPGVE